jgi:hypothetical protein
VRVRDTLGGFVGAIWEIHLEAVIERVWRPWHGCLEMHLEAMIERDWRVLGAGQSGGGSSEVRRDGS